MQEVTDSDFWGLVHQRGGADVYWTEYFRVHGVSNLEKWIVQSVRANPTGRPVVAQMIGNDIPSLVRSAKQLEQLPTVYSLGQNYPNPFNPTTTIGYVLQEKSNAKLTILNTIGEEMAVLVNEEQDKGYHKVEFDGMNLTSGVYFYRLQAGNYVETKKMLLLR